MTEVGELITPTGVLVLPPDRLGGEEWLQARRWRDPTDVLGPLAAGAVLDTVMYEREGYRIGSSDVPSILDLEGAGTPAGVYRAKVYDIRPEPNEAMEWGHLLEDAIATEWCRRNRAVIDEIGLVANVDEPWRQTTIDRRVRECPVSRSKGVHEECPLEVKNVDAHVQRRWHADIPDRILAQILDQLDVTGYGHAHWAALIGGNQLKQGIVWRDRETKLMTFIRSEVRSFRTDFLLASVEPAWSESKPDKMIELDEATHPERVGELDIDGIGEVMDYARAARAKADAEEERKRQGARVRQIANGREVLKFGGERAAWFTPTTRTNVDLDKLKEKYPEAYDDPEVVTETKGHTLHIDKAYKIAKGG